MSQEVSKWIVNGLQLTYKWGILRGITHLLAFTTSKYTPKDWHETLKVTSIEERKIIWTIHLHEVGSAKIHHLLPSGKLTWQWKIPILCWKYHLPIAMIVCQSVVFASSFLRIQIEVLNHSRHSKNMKNLLERKPKKKDYWNCTLAVKPTIF